MDFSNRSTQPQTVAPTAHVAAATPSGGKRGQSDKGKWGRVTGAVLVGAVAILLLALVAFIAFGGSNGTKEDKYVDTTKLQAVFLNTGQVYFGKIKVLNSSYFVVTNIYYLQTSSTGTTANANTSVSLVKLGCELHEPFDQMVINRSQVTFWENLQDNGQVAKAVSTFQKDNPNGQKCTDQSASSSTTTNSVQNATPSTTTKP